jgi:capsular polysaccharide export protein
MTQPTSFTALLEHRRTLLLQGPMGPFFAKLAAYLRAHEREVFKINFNGGDQLFFRCDGVYSYRAKNAVWLPALRHFLTVNQISAVVLFGQDRLIHRRVAALAKQLGVQLFVFEEGYIRPDYVTLEIGGVNGQSSLPRDRAFYDALPLDAAEASPLPVPARETFLRMAAYAVAYRLAMLVMHRQYPNDAYHRLLGAWAEAASWLLGSIRKLTNRRGDRAAMRQLTAPERSGRWFLMPLQVHNDSQILTHSSFPKMESAIDEVMTSFAAFAEAGHWLVIKHHPRDRAYRDFAAHIESNARRLNLVGRVHYVHDLHLPTLLEHTRAVVTVNSTTGMLALQHHKPVIMLGDSVCAVDGLINGGSLAEFWRNPGTVDEPLYQRFRHYLIKHTQLNASFYATTPALRAPGDFDGDVPRPISQHVNIWFALFLRELYARANNTVFGYVWIVAEPALHIAVLLAVFGVHGRSLASGLAFAPFALIGVLGYRVFRQVVERMMSVMDTYGAVFVYPQIFPIDVLLMRFAYEVLVVLVLFVLFISVAAFFYPQSITFPSIPLAVAAFVVFAVMSMGLGMMAFVLKQMSPKVAKFVPALTRDIYFVSGVFFSLGTLPTWAENILWWNPILQTIDILRQGILRGFSSPTSLGYVTLCSLISISMGSAVYFAFRHRVRGRV